MVVVGDGDTVVMGWALRGPRVRVSHSVNLFSVAFSAGEKLDSGEEEDVEDSPVDDEYDDVLEEDRKCRPAVWFMVSAAALSAGSCIRIR